MCGWVGRWGPVCVCACELKRGTCCKVRCSVHVRFSFTNTVHATVYPVHMGTAILVDLCTLVVYCLP